MADDRHAPDADPADDGAEEAMGSLDETTVLAAAVDEAVEGPAPEPAEPDGDDTGDAPKRPRKAAAIAAGLALVAVLGVGGA